MPFQNNTVLLVGGSGFIGSHLTHALLEAGATVRVLDVVRPRLDHPKLQWHEGSLLHGERLEQALDGCDIIYHLASTTTPRSSNEDMAFDVESNLSGSIKLLQLAAARDIKRFVFISSGGTVYGAPDILPAPEHSRTNPRCSYGIIKLAIEKYVLLFQQLHGLPACILRLSNPYGAYQRPDTGQGVIAAFCHRAAQGEPIHIWGDGNTVRDYLHINDATTALLLAAERDCEGQVLNIGSGIGHSVNDIIACIEECSGQQIEKRYHPARPFDIRTVYLDITAAQQVLGWQPSTALEDGITSHMREIAQGKA